MKKKQLTVLLILLPVLFVLSGCSGIRSRVEKILWEHSGVPEELSYIQYQQMEESDALDGEGFYRSPELEQYELSQIKPGPIHVSFARNDFLHFDYFLDARMLEPLDTADCWLNPGDTIYFSEPKPENPYSSLYQFSEFRIYELDENNRVKQLMESVKNVSGELFQIPEDFEGLNISIVPLGEYRERTVKLSAAAVNAEGKRTSLENGSWEINGKRYGNVRVKLKPMESYRIVYDYSPYQGTLYFAGSKPESYWENSRDSLITFLAEPSDNDYMEYEVILHPYGTMTLTNSVSYQNMMDSFLDGAAAIFGNKSVIETQNIISLLQVNGVTALNNFSDTEISLSDLKVGDEILIRVPADLKVISEDITGLASVENESGRDYLFEIPDAESMDFHLAVTQANSNRSGVYHEYVLENADFEVYSSSGIRYAEGSELPAEGEKVTVRIVPKEKFCVYGKNVKDNVYQAEMKYSDLISNLNEIIENHPVKPGIFVTLDSEDDLGECAFWTGTERLTGTVMLREGQDLQFDYLLNPDAGYEVYLTPEERMQGVDIWSPYAASRQLNVTDELQGKTLRCRDFVNLQKGVKRDAANPY